MRRSITTDAQGGLADASVDQTEARKATVRRFGRSDRSALQTASRAKAAVECLTPNDDSSLFPSWRSSLWRPNRTSNAPRFPSHAAPFAAARCPSWDSRPPRYRGFWTRVNAMA
jgi:hypothetical protein